MTIRLLMVLLIASSLLAAEIPKVPPRVWADVRSQGAVTVIVMLNLPNNAYGIDRVQDEVLLELAGTIHKVYARYQFIPAMAITVGADALTILERSARVKQIEENHVGRIQ
jgi:hypothetical protein